VDYYGLPHHGIADWPGRAEAASIKVSERARFVEEALFRDVAAEIGDPRRFVPFVVMHEFETCCSVIAKP